jgi:hypothetical protein
MSTATLSDRVWNVAISDTPIGFEWGIQHLHKGPSEGALDAAGDSTLVLDCAEWGYVYGVAFGIARGEDVFESPGDVAERALKAARSVWERYSNRPLGVEA